MRYIIISILSLSLPVVVLASRAFEDENTTAKILQQKIQNKVGYNICDPEKKLHLPQFN